MLSFILPYADSHNYQLTRSTHIWVELVDLLLMAAREDNTLGALRKGIRMEMDLDLC